MCLHVQKFSNIVVPFLFLTDIVVLLIREYKLLFLVGLQNLFGIFSPFQVTE